MLSKKCKSMNFVCCNCGELIHGPSMVVDNKFLHLNCVTEFIEEDNEDVELEEA